jgi:metal-responsive CopG/Arc/MetJ family transcriptional regulator
MSTRRRITVTLSDEVLSAADEAAATHHCSRSRLIDDALRWYLRIQALPVEEPTTEEKEALEVGRAQHARGEVATLDEIRRDLEADLLAQRSKKPSKAPV